jgi:hypothetical protein
VYKIYAKYVQETSLYYYPHVDLPQIGTLVNDSLTKVEGSKTHILVLILKNTFYFLSDNCVKSSTKHLDHF